MTNGTVLFANIKCFSKWNFFRGVEGGAQKESQMAESYVFSECAKNSEKLHATFTVYIYLKTMRSNVTSRK